MTHTIATANGFKIEQRGVGQTWTYFMATREDVAEIKTHKDLGKVVAWCDEQPPSEWAELNKKVGDTLKEIADKGFTQWAMGSSYDELTEKESEA